MSDVYAQLAKKLDQLPNGFPSTSSGVEIKILRKIFSPDEAEMALKIRPIPETADSIAQRLGKSVDEMQAILDDMVNKGQIGSSKMFDSQLYMAVPFVVGIYEFQLPRIDKELSDLFEEYAPSLLGTLGNYAPALMRVVPINVDLKGQQTVLVYEDVKKMLAKAKAIQVVDCICVKERATQGHECKHPVERCFAFSNHEGAFDKYKKGRLISKEEALEIMEKCEQQGLVHSTYNVQKGQMFVCNCCSCCCGIIRGMKDFNAPFLMAKSNFAAQIDPDKCVSCGVCKDERCPMEAIVEQEGLYEVQPERCIGCGVCTPTCPSEAIALVRKPESEQDLPPETVIDWYGKRAASRGIKIAID
jgi:Na+-translocating ferredoxin:NAD+ oxidoreductase subunit B